MATHRTPELLRLQDDLHALTARVQGLAEHVPDACWTQRPTPDAWSASECVTHLNLTSEAYLPRIAAAIDAARAEGRTRRGRLRQGLLGGFLRWSLEPPVRFRYKTSAAFVPGANAPKQAVVQAFAQLQRQLLEALTAADGLDLNRARVESPFDARVHYNLYAGFHILAAHQRRHLWQAEQAVRACR